MSNVHDPYSVEPSSEVDGQYLTYSLFASLYLSVLAFFILLNSISTVDDLKSRKALSSLYSSFADSATGTDIELSSPKMFEAQLALTKMYNNAERVVSRYFQIEDVHLVREGTNMRMTLPIHSLFLPNEVIFTPEKKDFLDNLAHSLTPKTSNITVHMRALLGSVHYLRYDPEDALELDVLRAGVVTRLFSRRGVSPKHITVGVRPEDTENITLYFTVDVSK